MRVISVDLGHVGRTFVGCVSGRAAVCGNGVDAETKVVGATTTMMKMMLAGQMSSLVACAVDSPLAVDVGADVVMADGDARGVPAARRGIRSHVGAFASGTDVYASSAITDDRGACYCIATGSWSQLPRWAMGPGAVAGPSTGRVVLVDDLRTMASLVALEIISSYERLAGGRLAQRGFLGQFNPGNLFMEQGTAFRSSSSTPCPLCMAIASVRAGISTSRARPPFVSDNSSIHAVSSSPFARLAWASHYRRRTSLPAVLKPPFSFRSLRQRFSNAVMVPVHIQGRPCCQPQIQTLACEKRQTTPRS